MHSGNLGNDYQHCYPEYDKTPKSVIAAVAFSIAMRICEEDRLETADLLRSEWKTLHINGIIPQKPREKKEKMEQRMNQCDHGHETRAEVRLLPTSEGPGHGNVIVCQRHFEMEMAYRREQRMKYGDQWVIKTWEALKPYEP